MVTCCPRVPFDLFAHGGQNDVPLLAGVVANEGATMPTIDTLHAFEAQARADFGEGADRFLQLYSAGSDSQARDASRTAFSYRNFYWQNFCWMRLQARTGKAPIYAYEFTRAPPIPARATYDENATDKFGAFHGSEIPYIFRTFGVPGLGLDRGRRHARRHDLILLAQFRPHRRSERDRPAALAAVRTRPKNSPWSSATRPNPDRSAISRGLRSGMRSMRVSVTAVAPRLDRRRGLPDTSSS